MYMYLSLKLFSEKGLKKLNILCFLELLVGAFNIALIRSQVTYNLYMYKQSALKGIKSELNYASQISEHQEFQKIKSSCEWD